MTTSLYELNHYMSYMRDYSKDTQGTDVNRIWVTYNKEKRAIHCLFCLVFASGRCNQGPLIDDCSDWKRITTRIAEQ